MPDLEPTAPMQVRGGSISVAVGPDDGPNESRADEIVRAEISRLEQMFDTDDHDSLLNRWIRDPTTGTTDDFDRLLAAAITWQRVSHGAYNVSMRRLRDLWERAAVDGCQPSPGELHEFVDEIAEAPYRWEGGALRQLRSCNGLDLREIAPGFMVDAAAKVAMETLHLGGLAVSAHDRVVHRGSSDVGISTDVLPECFGDVEFVLRDAAVTFVAETRELSQGPDGTLDPLTGKRVSHTLSVAVVAPDATTSDVVAAVVRAMPAVRGLGFVRALGQPVRRQHPSEFLSGIASGPIRCWILDSHRAVHDSDEYQSMISAPSAVPGRFRRNTATVVRRRGLRT